MSADTPAPSESSPAPAAAGSGPTPPHGPRRRRVSGRRKALFALITLLLLLVLGELTTRVVDAFVRKANFASHDPATHLYQPDPFLQLSLIPGARLVDPAQTITVDSRGFRAASELALPGPEGAFRVVCVGGSTTFGASAPTDDATYPALLERKLRAAFPGRTIDVVNAGVPGYTTFHNLPNLALRVLPLEPDAVVFYEAVNDLPLHRKLAGDPWTHRVVRAKKAEHSLLDRLLGHSLLFLVVRNQYEEAQRRNLRAPPADLPDAVDPAGPRAFERNYRGMIALTRAAGAEPVVVTFASALVPEPTPEDERLAWDGMYATGVSYQGLRAAYATYNGIARRLAAEGPATLAEADPVMTGRRELFTDLVHLTEAGRERLSDVVFEAIRPLAARKLGAP